MTEEKLNEKLLYTLHVYKDKTFVFRSHSGEVRGKWTPGLSLIGAMLMLMMGLNGKETT